MGRINKTRINIKNLDNLLKDLDKKISIRVGIIGEQAYKKHPGSDLTNAELGTVHEFGATINHPGGTPYFIKEDGMAQFVSKSKGVDLPKTQPHTIVIPTRSFLRMPLLSNEGKSAVRKEFAEYVKEDLGSDRELNYYAYRQHGGMLKTFAVVLGFCAYNRVLEAFNTGGFGEWAPITTATKKHRIGSPDNPPLEDTGGFGEWAPITTATKKHRIGSPDNPPLEDTGKLKDSITWEVKET